VVGEIRAGPRIDDGPCRTIPNPAALAAAPFGIRCASLRTGRPDAGRSGGGDLCGRGVSFDGEARGPHLSHALPERFHVDLGAASVTRAGVRDRSAVVRPLHRESDFESLHDDLHLRELLRPKE